MDDLNKKQPLSEEYMRMIYEIRSLSEKFEVLYGVDNDGILSFPNPMFIIFLEQEVYELKERIGLPLFTCQRCKKEIKSVDEFVKSEGKEYIPNLLEKTKKSMQNIVKYGDFNKKQPPNTP